MDNHISQRRIELLDRLKGVAGILTLFGHVIIMGNGEVFRETDLYFNDKVFQLIYSFHMPLFMLISGFLFGRSVRLYDRKKTAEQIFNKAKKLIVPLLLFSVLDLILSISNWISAGIQINIKIVVLQYLILFVTERWFLWSVFWCFLFSVLWKNLLKENPFVLAALFLIMFAVPDGLNLGAYKYMLPYFIIGNKLFEVYYDEGMRKRAEKLLSPGAFIAFALLFAALLSHYNGGMTVYISGYKLIGKNILNQLYIDSYRFLIGLSGSVVMTYLIYFLSKTGVMKKAPDILSHVGKSSMGIYLLSQYTVVYIFNNLTDSYYREKAAAYPNYLLTLLETALALIICLILIKIMKKLPILKYMV